jgi:hypothetical protein
MVRPATPPGVTGPNTLVVRSLEIKPPATQCAGRAFASEARIASPNAPVPLVNSL